MERCRIESIQELNSIVGKYDRVIIYGAGIVAQTFIRYCEYKRWKSKIKYILVSDVSEEPKLFKGKKILSVQDIIISEQEIVLVAVKEKNQPEILNILKKFTDGKVAIITDECSDRLFEICDMKMACEGERLETMCQALEIRDTHIQTFGKYQNKFYGKNVAIIATGPSLNKYKPLRDVINIGVNAAYKCDKVNLDYIFFQDYGGNRKLLIDDILHLPCEKFFGKYMENSIIRMYESNYCCQVPEGKLIDLSTNRYFIESPSDGEFYRDIRYYPLVGHGSVVFAAIQFALFGNPRKIYLVGCDCSDSGHFDSVQKTGMNTDIIYEGYLKLKIFCEWHYPNTEIVSINPVGLKGVFKDLYQDES